MAGDNDDILAAKITMDGDGVTTTPLSGTQQTASGDAHRGTYHVNAYNASDAGDDVIVKIRLFEATLNDSVYLYQETLAPGEHLRWASALGPNDVLHVEAISINNVDQTQYQVHVTWW